MAMTSPYYDIFDTSKEEEYLEQELRETIQRVASNAISKGVLRVMPINKQDQKSLLVALESNTSIRELTVHRGGPGGIFRQASHFAASLPQGLQHLSLIGCGYEASDLADILPLLASAQTLKGLHISQSGSRIHQPASSPLAAGPPIWPRLLLQSLPHLQDLSLSAIGLSSSDVLELFHVLGKCPHKLNRLDVSGNFESLSSLLDLTVRGMHRCSSSRAPSFFSCLKSIIVTQGASSSCCLDSQLDSTVVLLERLVHALQLPWVQLETFGPIALLPLDRQTPPTELARHRKCQALLRQVQFVLDQTSCRLRHVPSRPDDPKLFAYVATKCGNTSSGPSLVYDLLRHLGGVEMIVFFR